MAKGDQSCLASRILCSWPAEGEGQESVCFWIGSLVELWENVDQ